MTGASSQTLQMQIDAAFVAGGGTVYIPRGVTVLDAPLILRSRVRLLGEGMYASTLQLAKGLRTTAAVMTDGFLVAQGKDLWNYRRGVVAGHQVTYTESDGLHMGVALEELSIDGNHAAGSSGHGVCIYGGAFTLRGVGIFGCDGHGLWTQCGTPEGGWHGDAAYNFANMHEALISEVRIASVTGHGVLFRGPNDSAMDRVLVKSAAQRGFSIEGAAGGLKVGTLHCYSCHGDRSILISAANVLGDELICDTPYHDGICLSGRNNVFDRIWVPQHNRLRTAATWGLTLLGEANCVNHYRYVNSEAPPLASPALHGGALNLAGRWNTVPHGYLWGGGPTITVRGAAVAGDDAEQYGGQVREW